MNQHSVVDRGQPFRKPAFDIESELQKLVDAEYAGLGQQAKPKRVKVTETPPAVYEDSDTCTPADVRLPFSPDEEAFIASATTFLNGRANADMLLEAITSRALRQSEALPSNENPDPAKGEGDA